jgi:hypothetical protein
VANAKAAQADTRTGAVAAATVLVLAAWCAPAVASSGIDIHCPQSESALDNPLSSVSPDLASHSESALQDILDDTTVATLPALAEAIGDAGIDEAESAEEPATRTAETPPMTTRLPGAPESSLPSFRRHMHRTDI